jgi:3-oxoacyl-[acyl-carrier protein] reductase
LKTKPRNILISGSSKGLGKQLVNLLEDPSLRIITMGYETPSDVDIRCNLLDLSVLEVELKRVFECYGAIDVLICNAGTGRLPTEISSETRVREYFREKNFQTAKNLLNATRPYLKTPGASVIGISSIVALTEIPEAPTGYSEAKKEMNQYFREQAIELARYGIRVNLISPGNIFFSGSRWEQIALENPKFVEELLREKVPLHEFISPDDIASAILYLSSDQAKNITGINLVVDGGQVL